VERLDEIPGIGPVAGAVIIPEIGIDMTGSPPLGTCTRGPVLPGVKSSAGKNKGNGSTGHGNWYLARVLGEAAVNAAVNAARTDTFLGERYRRIAQTPRKEEDDRGGRPLHPGHRRHLLSDPTQASTTSALTTSPDTFNTRYQEEQPRPTARSPRLPSHPRTRRLNQPDQIPGSAALRRKLSPAQSPFIFGLETWRRIGVEPGSVQVSGGFIEDTFPVLPIYTTGLNEPVEPALGR